jgi:hypothetical protein
MLTLDTIASALNGKISRKASAVLLCGYLAQSHKKLCKRKKPDITVYLNGHDTNGRPLIGVNCHRPEYDPLQVKDEIYRVLGFSDWKRTATAPSFEIRNQFFGECLRGGRSRGFTEKQFLLFGNDFRPPADYDRAETLKAYGAEFGIDPEIVRQAIETPHRTYTASERAEIWQLTYDERQRLKLRRTRWVGADGKAVDWETVERARRDRYNVIRRAHRAAIRAQREAHKNLAREPIKASAVPSGVSKSYPSYRGDIGGATGTSESPLAPVGHPNSGLGGVSWVRKHRTDRKPRLENRRTAPEVRPKRHSTIERLPDGWRVARGADGHVRIVTGRGIELPCVDSPYVGTPEQRAALAEYRRWRTPNRLLN